MFQRLSKLFSRRFNFNLSFTVGHAAALFLLLGMIGFGYSFIKDGTFDIHQFFNELSSNLGIEFMSIAVTVLIIERLNRQAAERERKEELILQMGSPDNAFAVEAVRILRQKGWLSDGSLKKAPLWDANLQCANLISLKAPFANLVHANLQKANLDNANLQNADMERINLQKASLWGADLQRAKLKRADLQETISLAVNLNQAVLISANLSQSDLRVGRLQRANLEDANFFEVDLSGADLEQTIMYYTNLKGASLKNANLKDAKLKHVLLDEKCVLPDGTLWCVYDADLRRFTDPKHPDFWRPKADNSDNYPLWYKEGDGS